MTKVDEIAEAMREAAKYLRSGEPIHHLMAEKFADDMMDAALMLNLMPKNLKNALEVLYARPHSGPGQADGAGPKD
jgi:hypothetical protein